MASYFEEHNCEPLRDGERPNELLHLARLLIDGGYDDLEAEFNAIYAGQIKPPPASKKVVEELPTFHTTAAQEAAGLKCPVCLCEFEERDEMKKLPCEHHFHPKCIETWLEKTNSCPMCRYELPTDDKNYEEIKRQKARQKQAAYELETLHDSMFG